MNFLYVLLTVLLLIPNCLGKEKLKCYTTGENKWDFSKKIDNEIDKGNFKEFVTCQSDDDVCCLRKEKFIVKDVKNRTESYDLETLQCMSKVECQPSKKMSDLMKKEWKKNFLKYYWNHTSIYPVNIVHRISGFYCETNLCNPNPEKSTRLKRNPPHPEEDNNELFLDGVDSMELFYKSTFTKVDDAKKEKEDDAFEKYWFYRNGSIRYLPRDVIIPLMLLARYVL